MPPEHEPRTQPSELRKDRGREMREAVVEDADKTEGKDRDLVHGEAGRSDSTTMKI